MSGEVCRKRLIFRFDVQVVVVAVIFVYLKKKLDARLCGINLEF